jgi:hypothetical protein
MDPKDNQEKNEVQQAESLTESGPKQQATGIPGKQGKLTRLQTQIKAKSAIQTPGPFGPNVIHRVRNEHTEKEWPEGQLCNGKLPGPENHATVIDRDVTCPDCKQAILDRIKSEKKMASEPEPASGTRKCRVCSYTEDLSGPPTIHTRDWYEFDLCEDCHMKMTKSNKPEPETEIKSNPILDDLFEKRQAMYELQQAQVTILQEMSEKISDLSSNLSGCLEELVTLNTKE